MRKTSRLILQTLRELGGHASDQALCRALIQASLFWKCLLLLPLPIVLAWSLHRLIKLGYVRCEHRPLYRALPLGAIGPAVQDGEIQVYTLTPAGKRALEYGAK